MSNPAGKRDDAPLSAEVLEKVRALAAEDGCDLLENFPGLGGNALTRALAGLPVRGATRRLIELGLEQIEAKR